jgi:hypothetical protein
MGEIPMHLAKDAAECNRAFKDFATSRSWEEAPQAQPTPEAHQLLGWIRMPIPAPELAWNLLATIIEIMKSFLDDDQQGLFFLWL